MASVFTKIINGDIPGFKIAEDEDFYAFLDINALAKGHVLIVPKEETDRFFEVSDRLLMKWLLFAKPIARAIEQAFECDRCGISVIGLEVPHAHMHLVPINSANDLNFTREKLKLTERELRESQEKIRSFL